MSDEDKKTISLDEAIKRLPRKQEIHTFRNPGSMMLVGADWDRDDIIEALTDASEIEETGPQAMAMNHGLGIMHEGRWLFIETTCAPPEPSHGKLT